MEPVVRLQVVRILGQRGSVTGCMVTVAITMVVKAGLSRMYGGIHYRFDCEIGQDLGRQVAAYTLSQAVGAHEPIPLD